MIGGGRQSWNLRDRHMDQTLDRLLWFDETRALRPLPTRRVDALEPETYPSGR